MEYYLPKEPIYNDVFKDRKNVILWDVQKIKNGQFIKVVFISTNSPRKQGIFLMTDKGIEVNGVVSPSIDLWEDTAPKEVICKCYTNNGLLNIYNIWEKQGMRSSQAHTSGMLLEYNENKIIYHCNDFGFETDFDRLVFSIEFIDDI